MTDQPETDPILVPERFVVETRYRKTDNRRAKDYRGHLEVLISWPERKALLARYRPLRQQPAWHVTDGFVRSFGEANLTNYTINRIGYDDTETIRIVWYIVAAKPSEIPDEETMVWRLAKQVSVIGGNDEGVTVRQLAKTALQRWACILANEFYDEQTALIQEAEDIERAEAWLHDCARFYVERAKTESRYAQRCAALRAEVEVEAVMQMLDDPPDFDDNDNERVRALVDKHMKAAVQRLAASTIGFRGGAFNYRIPREEK